MESFGFIQMSKNARRGTDLTRGLFFAGKLAASFRRSELSRSSSWIVGRDRRVCQTVREEISIQPQGCVCGVASGLATAALDKAENFFLLITGRLRFGHLSVWMKPKDHDLFARFISGFSVITHLFFFLVCLVVALQRNSVAANFASTENDGPTSQSVSLSLRKAVNSGEIILVNIPGQSSDSWRVQGDGTLKTIEIASLEDSGVLSKDEVAFLKRKGIFRIRLDPHADSISITYYYPNRSGTTMVPRWENERKFDWDAKSSDLEEDSKLIWTLVETSAGRRPPMHALGAAIRLFNTLKTKGKTSAEVKTLFHAPDHDDRVTLGPQSGLKFGALVFTFDSGVRRVELVFELDGRGKVKRAKKIFNR